MADSQGGEEEVTGTTAFLEKQGDEFVCTCPTQPPIVARGATSREAVALLKTKLEEAVRDGVVDRKDLEGISRAASGPAAIPLSGDVKKILGVACGLSRAAGKAEIGLEHLSAALARFGKENTE